MMPYRHLILDSLNHAHRCWSRGRNSVTRDSSLERGFLEKLIELRRGVPGAEIVLAWDGAPDAQRKENPNYKRRPVGAEEGRPADWRARCDALREALSHVLPTLYSPCVEADNEIARFVRAADGRVLIVSTDGDMRALLSERVDVFRPGLSPALYRLEDFRREHGFPPSGLALFKALTGDRTNNVRGLYRFPRKVAGQLAARCGTVDGLYDALRRREFAEALTLGQLDQLREGEAQVRSNARVLDLLADTAAPHLTAPARPDVKPLKALLGPLQLGHLAAPPFRADRLYLDHSHAKAGGDVR